MSIILPVMSSSLYPKQSSRASQQQTLEGKHLLGFNCSFIYVLLWFLLSLCILNYTTATGESDASRTVKYRCAELEHKKNGLYK